MSEGRGFSVNNYREDNATLLDERLFIIVAALMVMFFCGMSVGVVYFQHAKSRMYYERGAHFIALYHSHRGNYGSKALRDAAFTWGDPQDEEDLAEIERIARGKDYQ